MVELQWELIAKNHMVLDKFHVLGYSRNMNKDPQICEVDFDHSYYLGTEEDGVYFTAAKGCYANEVVVEDRDIDATHNAIHLDGTFETMMEELDKNEEIK